MSLYEQWNDIFENSTPEQVQAFFEVYYEKERDAYAEILGAKENKISGTMAELAEKFKFEQVEMLGLLMASILLWKSQLNLNLWRLILKLNLTSIGRNFISICIRLMPTGFTL